MKAPIATTIATALLILSSGRAAAQQAELAYDDGTAAGALQNLSGGDIELVRMTPAHPAHVTAVRVYFAVAGGCLAHVKIWADDGGNAPDLDQVLFEQDVVVDATGWLEIPVDGVSLEPPKNFYVGHVLDADGPACQLAWDGSGSDETHSLARIGGSWFYVSDGSDPPKSIDALGRAEVTYFNVIDQPWFSDASHDAALPHSMYRVAWADYDNDGDPDLLVSGKQLFRNNGDGTFSDVTDEAGIGDVPANGGVWADYDNDGYVDFYATVNNYLPNCTTNDDCVYCTLTTAPDGSHACDQYQHDYTCSQARCTPPTGKQAHDVLWHNEGDGTFSDASESAQRPYDYLPTEAAAWGDYDNDGYVDLYVANYETPATWTEGAIGRGTPDLLWHNEGNGTFRNASEEAGLRVFGQDLCGRGVAWADWDDDGDQDIYVANYRLNFNYLWENRGDGTFENASGDTGTAGVLIQGQYGHSIGADWADMDNDGDWDLFVANLAHPRFIQFSDKSMLYVNGGSPDFHFVDRRAEANITYSETHSDPAWGDFDNDGWQDLFITDVYVGYRAFLYHNEHSAPDQPSFKDVTYPSGLVVDNGWGSAWADYDGDGDLDLTANGLWRNDVPNPGHFLEIHLRGTRSNASAIGAVVTVTAADLHLKRQVEGGRGTGNQNPMTLHFGLAGHDQADIEIHWPSGLVENHHLAADQRITYVENSQDDDGGIQDGGSSQDAGDATAPAQSGSGCTCRTESSPDGPLAIVAILCLTILWRKRRRTA